MTSEIINGYTFFPHPANWTTPPAWQRAWENEIAQAVTGDESRQGMRGNPRNQLSFLLTPWSVWEQAELDDRVMEARKSGLACAPYWGRSSVLADALSGSSTTATLEDNAWGFKAGDYIFLYNPAAYPSVLNYDLIQLVSVAGVTLTLPEYPSQGYPAGALVWPLIYGEFTCKDMSVATAQRGTLQVTIRELSTPASAATVYGPGEAPSGSGIGFMKIGANFTIG